MTDHPNTIRYARRFTATIPSQPDIHGIQFPSGHVIADTPVGVTAFPTIDVITDSYEGAVIHWADEAEEAQR